MGPESLGDPSTALECDPKVTIEKIVQRVLWYHMGGQDLGHFLYSATLERGHFMPVRPGFCATCTKS